MFIFDKEKTFISSSGVGCVTEERMGPKAPLTEVIQLRLAYEIVSEEEVRYNRMNEKKYSDGSRDRNREEKIIFWEEIGERSS